MKKVELKKYHLFDKSIFGFMIFQLLLISIYILTESLFYNFLITVFFTIFYFFGRAKIRKNINLYFKYLFVSYMFMLLLNIHSLYLIIGKAFYFVFPIVFIFWLYDFYLFKSGINRVIIFNQENIFKNFDNLDQSCIDCEYESGHLWMVSQWFFNYVLIIYMFIIGPYFFIFNYHYYFSDYANLVGYRIGTLVYADILLLIIFWQIILKKVLFFSKILDLKIEIKK